jgi:uncharacterized protein (TIGR02646 family)
MRHIRKRAEPADFAAWKQSRARTWEDLAGERKQRVREALLAEQGHLCCYCCRGLKAESGHIEHLAPRAKYPGRQLDYANLLLSCDGIDAKAAHCGHRKGERELLVTPLQPACADCFRYTHDGQILPVKDGGREDAAASTIRTLALDTDRLTELRKRVIRVDLGLWGPRRGAPLSETELLRLYQHYLHEDRAGTRALPEFLPARLYALRQTIFVAGMKKE